MQYVFTAVFVAETDGTYSASFPDIPGCRAEGDDLIGIIKNAEDNLRLCMFNLEEMGLPIPIATPQPEIRLQNPAFASTLVVDTDGLRKKYFHKTSKSTLELPTWLQEAAESRKVDFEEVMQNALKEEIGLPRETPDGRSTFGLPKRNRPVLLVVSLVFVFLAIIGVVAYFIYQDFIVPRNISLAQLMMGSPPVIAADPVEPEPAEAEPPDEYELHEVEYEVEYEADTLTEYEPESEPVVEPEPEPREPRQEFLDFRAEFDNEDIVGRLWIPGTSIDSLVLQGPDNEIYLYQDIWGNQSSAGWIYLDYQADIGWHDQNWVIYGHNMSQDIMFHSLRHYANADFFNRNSRIYFSTIYEDYVWEVFSFYVASVYFPYTHINFPSQEAWGFWIEQFAEASIHDSDVSVNSYDRILTLSTCVSGGSSGTRDQRYVLHARLIR